MPQTCSASTRETETEAAPADPSRGLMEEKKKKKKKTRTEPGEKKRERIKKQRLQHSNLLIYMVS